MSVTWSIVIIVDIAITVFNQCTKDNAGVAIQGGTEVMTKDSDDYEVTFNYEFLEDFRDKTRHRSTRRKRNVRSNSGYLEHIESDGETLTGTDERDGCRRGSTLGRFFHIGIGGKDEYQNSWGPEGFNKQNHPLTVMVRNYICGLWWNQETLNIVLLGACIQTSIYEYLTD